jgi:hypothetical protein
MSFDSLDDTQIEKNSKKPLKMQKKSCLNTRIIKFTRWKHKTR